jgi:hypothetical protein
MTTNLIPEIVIQYSPAHFEGSLPLNANRLKLSQVFHNLLLALGPTHSKVIILPHSLGEAARFYHIRV